MSDQQGPTTTAAADLEAEVSKALAACFAAARRFETPYRHWTVAQVFPARIAGWLEDLPFAAPDLGGVSGKRELHNDARHYFDAANNTRFAACGAVARAFQSAPVVAAIGALTGADLRGTCVRLEYAQDTDGFWLEPHTDLGVKRFTMLIYLGPTDGQEDLGTDVYRAKDAWAKQIPFTANTALIFVPADNTWHGLAPRRITGVRRSVIMNYVTDGWRAREQLAYPKTPVV
ncbi:MAG TPA: 2OG-Fe(II) oxygenase [Caulobacteraceae bacterium]